jgi:hypothetical protein
VDRSLEKMLLHIPTLCFDFLKKQLRPKSGEKIGDFYLNYCYFGRKRTITMVVHKTTIFSPKIGESRRKLAKVAENWRKSPKIVIMQITNSMTPTFFLHMHVDKTQQMSKLCSLSENFV